MADASQKRFNWWLPMLAAVGTVVAFVTCAIYTSESLGYILLVLPIVSFALIALLIVSFILNRRLLATASVLLAFWIISLALVRHYDGIREKTRWWLWSREFKAEVMEAPVPSTREFRHVGWDGWGWVGSNTEVYLVFDPADSLSSAANGRPATASGIPCKVPVIRRLERQWYAVQFYANEGWDGCSAGGLFDKHVSKPGTRP